LTAIFIDRLKGCVMFANSSFVNTAAFNYQYLHFSTQLFFEGEETI
jgi:hypothetical protein